MTFSMRFDTNAQARRLYDELIERRYMHAEVNATLRYTGVVYLAVDTEGCYVDVWSADTERWKVGHRINSLNHFIAAIRRHG